MRKQAILQKPSRRRRAEFLTAVRRSKKLHSRWVSPPQTPEAFQEYLKRIRSKDRLGYWIVSEDGDIAGVININEIGRGSFCSGYLGYGNGPSDDI
jgi:ribosomal-protein-alanine N-acetyltransferase